MKADNFNQLKLRRLILKTLDQNQKTFHQKSFQDFLGSPIVYFSKNPHQAYTIYLAIPYQAHQNIEIIDLWQLQQDY